MAQKTKCESTGSASWQPEDNFRQPEPDDISAWKRVLPDLLSLLPLDNRQFIHLLFECFTPEQRLYFLECMDEPECGEPLTEGEEGPRRRPLNPRPTRGRMRAKIAHLEAALEVAATERGFKTLFAEKLNRMKPKERKCERDARIVELANEGMPHKHIGRRLMDENPEWVGKNGKPLTTAAIKVVCARKRKRKKVTSG